MTGFPFPLRARNLFDPNRPPPQPDIPTGSVFSPYGNPVPPQDIGQQSTQTGNIFSVPNMSSIQNQYGPLGPQTTQQVTPEMAEPDYMTQINDLYHKLYTPSTVASDRVNDLINNMPQRNQVGKLRTLGSLLVGMSQGPEAQEKLTYAPYYRQMADWKAKLDPSLKSAELERYTNANERQLAYQQASSTIQAQRAKTAVDAEERRRVASEAKTKTDAARARTADFKARNPNWYKVQGEDGNVWLVPPRPDMGRPYNTGLQDADYTDFEKERQREEEIAQGIEGRIRVRQTPDARATNLDDPRNWQVRDMVNRQGQIVGTIRINRATGAIGVIPPSGNVPQEAIGASGSVMTRGTNQNQLEQGLSNSIQEFVLRNKWAERFIQQDPQGQWHVTPPGQTLGFDTGPTPEQYEQILQGIGMSQGAPRTQTPRPTQQPGGRERTTKRGTRVTELP